MIRPRRSKTRSRATAAARLLAGVAFLTLALTVMAEVTAEANAETPPGTVRLPLDQYLELKEKIRTAEDTDDVDDSAAGVVVEARSTDVVLREALEVASAFADTAPADPVAAFGTAHSAYRLLVRRALDEPVELTFGGYLTGVELTRQGTPDGDLIQRAGVRPQRPGRVEFFASEPGTYSVILHSEVVVHDPLRPTFSWPASQAARDVLSLELASGSGSTAGWTSEAPLLRDEMLEEPSEGTRRRLTFSVPPGRQFAVELQAHPEAATRGALVRTTLVTLADLDDEGLRLQDAVVYRVLRGAIGSHRIVVPAGRSLLRDAFTDEGTRRADPGRPELVLERQRLLGPGAGTAEIGHVLLPYEAVPLSDGATAGVATDRVPLPAPGLDETPQARYLVLASTVAAELTPRPTDAWRRVDLGDLPDAVRGLVTALEPGGVWQWRGGTSDSPVDARSDSAALDVRRLPPTPTLEGLVWHRETTTVLTVDGSLVHRDVFEVELDASAFVVRLPGGASLWSTTVDGTPVRPLEEAGRVLIPVGFRRDGTVEVEVVSVQQQAIEKGRSEIRFDAPGAGLPVLDHRWRLLLPESARYRVDESVLDVASGHAFVALGDPLPGVQGTGIVGRVVGDDGYPLPGVTLTLEGTGTNRVQISDADGIFQFLSLEPGRYGLRGELEGFSTTEIPSLDVRRDKIRSATLELYAAVAETLTVTAEAPLLDQSGYRFRMDEWRGEGRSRRQKEESGRVIEDLQGLLTTGVKPLPVSIPESGKVVTLAGALPPEAVWVTVDVRNR